MYLGSPLPPKCPNGSVYDICVRHVGPWITPCSPACVCLPGMLQSNGVCFTLGEFKSMLGFYRVDCVCGILSRYSSVSLQW